MNNLETLLPSIVVAVASAAEVLQNRFSPAARPTDTSSLLAAIEANDVAALEILRPALLDLLPGSGWVEDEEGPLPPRRLVGRRSRRGQYQSHTRQATLGRVWTALRCQG